MGFGFFRFQKSEKSEKIIKKGESKPYFHPTSLKLKNAP